MSVPFIGSFAIYYISSLTQDFIRYINSAVDLTIYGHRILLFVGICGHKM
jgi:hypothetical protein